VVRAVDRALRRADRAEDQAATLACSTGRWGAVNKRGHHPGLPADWEPSKKGRSLCERPSLGRKSDHGSSGEAVLDALVRNFGSGVRTSRDD
jgi:hypothetical protein